MSSLIFNGNLRPEFSLGLDHRDRITLYRGDKLSVLEKALEVGIFSTAFATGNAQSVWNFAGSCTTSSLGNTEAGMIINVHTTRASRNEGLSTPFISASPFLDVARVFANNSDEGIIEFNAYVGNLVAPPFSRPRFGLPQEVLVLGMIPPEDIVGMVE